MSALGFVMVGRPMRRLNDFAKRIGAGDLGGSLQIPQRDEIGELASEMNRMCTRLRLANERLKEETTARIGALEQLRHADRLKTVGTLASGIAHELGTPLNVVSGRAKMVADRRGERMRTRPRAAGSSWTRSIASPRSSASCSTSPAVALPTAAPPCWRAWPVRPSAC